MTSEEIKEKQDRERYDQTYWLKVIALQLAIANERNAALDKETEARRTRFIPRPPAMRNA